MRILVNDTVNEQNKIAEVIKLELGYEVIYSESTDSALELFNNCEIDLCFIGENMISEYYKQNLDITSYFKKKPFIVITDNNDQYTLYNNIEKGVQDIIIRDIITPTVLKNSICIAIERFKYMNNLLNQNRQLKNASVTDPLTCLYNRRGVVEGLKNLVKLQTRSLDKISVILFDCDNFKKINDKFGYATGDMVLTEVSKIFKKRLRDTDLVARIGGDEFLVVLPGSGITDSFNIAEELKNNVAQSDILAQYLVTVSGVVTEIDAKFDRLSFENIFNIFGTQLKKAKDNGKNGILEVDNLGYRKREKNTCFPYKLKLLNSFKG